MLELYLIGIIAVLTIGLVGREYVGQIFEFIKKKLEEE